MLLTTKFLRPTPDPRSVKRERLSTLLESGSPTRLNLVVSPAGFGKTTLLAQWCSQYPSASAWLSLDEHDNSPRRFWEYVIGAFEYAGMIGLEDCRKLLTKDSEDAVTAAITGLINALSTGDTEWNLVVDDFHFIHDSAILRQFAYFIDYLPPGITMTVASRTEPPLPLARWRVRRWIKDIHPGLMAFSETECLAFFRDTMGLDIAESDAEAIFRKTEGWVAAMQLAALSGGNSGSKPGTTSKINLDERYISDYVLTEVLDQQPEELRRFLLDTACCPRLCSSLCDAILEADGSQLRLEQLLAQNLFLIPLDTQNEWFRYHDLFREALLLRIRHKEPERADALWHRTVNWLLTHGHLQEAIGQVVKHQAWSWLATILAEHGNNLIHGGYHLPVLEWLDTLPPELVGDRPQLQMLRVWGLFFANRVTALEPLLTSLEDLLDRRVADSHPDAEGALGLHSEISLIRSYLARTKDDDKSATDLTLQVLKDIDHTQIPLKSVTYYGVGLDKYGKGDLTGAEETLSSAVRYGQLEHKPSTVLTSGGLLAWIQYNRGDIDSALDTSTNVRKWVDDHYSDPSQPRLISCWQNSALTEIYRERNAPDLAATHLAPLLEHVEQGTEAGQHVIIQYVRGHLAFSERRYSEAISVLQDAAQVGRRRREAILFEPPASSALLARCFLAMDQVDEAQACLDSEDRNRLKNPLHGEQILISESRVAVSRGEADRAIEILQSLRPLAQNNAHNRHLVEILLIYGEALHLKGQIEETQTALADAIFHARQAGFIRLMADESQIVRSLLANHPALTESSGDWEQSVLTMLQEEQEEVRYSSRPSARSPSQALAEPLSQREQEVLSLINDGHSNKEIASRMNVAPATVKAHIRNLYGKLGAGRRTEALARARQLGLFTS